MKKFLKSIACFAIAFVCLLGFSACGKKVSETTTSTSKTIYNGVQTNGGITAVYNGYLYFINGTKSKDGTNLKKTTRAAICRVKIDADGKIDKNTYEVVVKNLAGYDYGSLYFFGDYMYYTTPNAAVNYEDTVLYNQTKFMRYDLVNEKSYTLYTTKKNDSNEKISYAYYVVGDELDLVVYESVSETLTSIKIDKKTTTNYVIEGVKSAVLSDNNGKPENVNRVDANNFVFYTKAYTNTDAVKTNKVYSVSPNNDNSRRIYNESDTVSILSIKGGKLYFSLTDSSTKANNVYAKMISKGDETLSKENSEIISYKSYSNIIFMSGYGNITAVAHDSDSNEVVLLVKSSENEYEILPEVIKTVTAGTSSSSSSTNDNALSFITLTTVKEKIESDDEESGDGTELTEDVVYLIYRNNKKLYKLEIMRDGKVSKNDPIQLSTTEFIAPSNLLVPEVVGNYLYAFAKELGSDGKETDKVYLYRMDITISNDSKDKATLVGMKEDN